MNDPLPTSPSPPQPPAKRGSLLLGVGVAWATLIVGYVIAAVLIGALSDVSNDGLFLLLLLLPWIGMIGWIVRFATRDQPRTAIGILVGIASIIAVALLLVAACFGLLVNNWH